MSLARCPDCGREVSPIAPACPFCGRPANPRPVRPIEKTGKQWKFLTLASVVLLIYGIYACFTLPEKASDDQNMRAWGAVIGGLLMLSFARVGAWWYHG